MGTYHKKYKEIEEDFARGLTLKGKVTGIIIGSTSGASGDKVGFYGATPVIQPISTTDIRTALINLGLLATGGASPLNLNGGALTAGTITVADGGSLIAGTSSGLTIGSASTQVFSFYDGVNVGTGTTTGTKIGTASTHKLAFWGGTPMARTTFANAAVSTTGAVSTTTGSITSWGYSTSTQANAIVALTNEIRALLVAMGMGA